MSVPTVVTVFGTRPEAIKMAPVVRLMASAGDLDHKLIITAQHRRLLDDVLELFALEPHGDLDLMQQRQTLDYVASHVLAGVGEVLDRLRPDFVLVHGDTTTTAAAALAAFYRKLPVGHVEAGLRTSTIARPFPEELNRRIADMIAVHYYCPTPGAADNIRRCPEYAGEIYVTGNTALDAVRLMHDPDYVFADPALSDFVAHEGPKLLVTAHRRENWGSPMTSICRGLIHVLEDNKDARACFCWHPNPAVRETVGPLLLDQPRVLLTDPPRFDVFVNLMANCDLLITDSGGIQEEISLLRRYALVLRAETERPEAVEAGFASLVQPDEHALRAAVGSVLPRCLAGELPGSRPSPFGDGFAADRVVSGVRYYLGLTNEPPAELAPH